MKKLSLLLLSAMLLAGCKAGPNYKRPTVTVPEVWKQADSTVVLDSATLALVNVAWWELFGDSVLAGLVRTALYENHDIRIAAARVEEFMGLYGVAKSDLFPKVDLGASAGRGQIPAFGDPDVERPTRSLLNVNVRASWEIDLWGKVRRAKEAANADVLAAEETRRGVVLSLAAQVAGAYIDLLGLDQQLVIARQTAASRARSLELFEQRRSEGDVSDLEISQLDSEYWLAMSQIPQIEQRIAQLEHAISVLLGRIPGAIARGGVIDSLYLPVVPAGLPSELLERRPDVRAAEEQLVAANARIGVAKAQYFPSISLTGLFGFASSDLSNLLSPEARAWNVGGDLLQPLFRGGEIKGQVKAAEAVQKQALYAYVQTVHNAFRDVEDALVVNARTSEQLTAEANRVDALKVYAKLATMRYDEGVTGYLEVLDAERSLFASQLDYVQTQAGLLQSTIGIYSALAGGWVDLADSLTLLPGDTTNTDTVTTTDTTDTTSTTEP